MGERLARVTTWIFFGSLALLLVFRIEDTDTWMHLDMGREIFRLKGLPPTEPFTYPSFGKPFFYTSWLFGLLLYLLYLGGGYTAMILAKALVVLLALFVLYRDALLRHRERFVVLAVLSLFVVLFRHRFVERPEVVMMACLAYTAYAVNSYLLHGRRHIYWLPLVALVWANCHSSIVLMPLPFLAALAGGLCQRWLAPRFAGLHPPPTWHQLRVVLAVLAAAAATTLATPNVVAQLTYGQSILSGQWYKTMIVELNPLDRQGIVIVTAGILLLALSFVMARKRLFLADIFLVVPFALLPWSARRFLVVFGLVAAPVLARNLAVLVAASPRLQRYCRMPAAWCVLLVWIVLYTAGGVASREPFGQETKRFGFGVNETVIPAGAVRYLDSRQITGRTFSLFHWGGYLIWSGYPGRTVFIEPRGYLSEELLEQSSSALNGDLWTLERLHRTYGFETIILDYPTREEGSGTKRYGLVLTDPDWALVYWDDTALVYLRRKGSYQRVIEADEYRTAIPAHGRGGVSDRVRAGDLRALAGLEQELLRNVRQTGSSLGNGLLGHLYNRTGRSAAAITPYTRVLAGGRRTDRLAAYSGLGTAFYQLGDYDKSLRYYEQAIAISRDSAFLYNLATVYLARKETAPAIRLLEEVVRSDPEYRQAAELLAQEYLRQGRVGDAALLKRR